MATYPPQTEYNIPKDGYVAFDAMSLRELIIRRLNEQNVFTDQNYIGSNLASIIDIVAYSYNTLIYYLNKTSTESMFSEAQLYENMNRVVKLIDYKPVGAQTSTLNFNLSTFNFSQGIYTIPRYSFVAVNNIFYSFNEDISFAKTVNITTEALDELTQQKLLYQGKFTEYPIYTAAGENNETFTLETANEIVDHFNIDVYVKPLATGVWKQYTKTSNLYLENGFSEKYEIRLNGNGRYEIKFGDDINGKKIQTGDRVAVYYLKSLGAQGEIGPGAFSDQTFLTKYNTPQFQEILNDVTQNQFRFVTNAELANFYFRNTNSSTYSQTKENVDDIRKTAPLSYRSQYRLVTTQDYETYTFSNFANVIADVKCINNWDYVSGYLKYFYDIGLDRPSQTNRALFNQLQYADSCNFNNIYLLVVPKNTDSNNLNYLVPAQKELINSSIASSKMTTTEVAFIDPVYKAVTFGTNINTIFNTEGDLIPFELIVNKRSNFRRDNQSIVKDVANLFRSYFSKQNIRLGQDLDTRFITQLVLNIEGVANCYTQSTLDPTSIAPGVSFFVWNPLHPTLDQQIVNTTLPGRFFEYLYFNNIDFIENQIRVISDINTNVTAEF